MKKSTKIVLITAAALIVLGIIISSISLKDGANIEVRREDGSTNSPAPRRLPSRSRVSSMSSPPFPV